MALPIWALYMQKVYDDPALNFTKGDFDRPLKKLSFELDCDKYGKSDDSNNQDIEEIEF